MPMINIEYDSEKVEKNDMLLLCNAAQKIVSEVTKIEDVFVYCNSSQIKVRVAPIEIFVKMSDHKISDAGKLVKDIRSKLSEWKKNAGFKHKINLTLIPMKWNLELGI